MKLLYCQDCGDIVAPDRNTRVVRYCACLRHAVWWEDPDRGILRVNDTEEERGQLRAFVLGIHNGLLVHPGFGTSKKMVEDLIAGTHESYYFKQCESLIVRFRPGMSSDTAYAPLPQEGV